VIYLLLYILRHGDPIYSPDTLTQKGRLQADALAKRLASAGLDKVYSSPLGRAKETAQPTCDLLGLKYEIEEWTSESLAWKDFSMVMPDGKRRWTFSRPGPVLRNDMTIEAGAKWHELDVFSQTNAREGYDRICRASDGFLEKHGYRREGAVYRITDPNDLRIAVFCHEGFSLTWLSHLLGIPPHIFWTGFGITHSGLTLLQFYNHDEGYTVPRCLCHSDLSHIYGEGLPMTYNNTLRI